MAKLFTPLRCIDAAIALLWERACSSAVPLAGIEFAKCAQYRGDADAIRIALHKCLRFALRDPRSKGVLLAVKDHAANGVDCLKFSVTVFREPSTLSPTPATIPKLMPKLKVHMSEFRDQRRYSFIIKASCQGKKNALSATVKLGNTLLVCNDPTFAHLFKRRIQNIDGSGEHRICRDDEQALQMFQCKSDLIFIDHASVDSAMFESTHRRVLAGRRKLVSVRKGDETSLPMHLETQMLSHHWVNLRDQISQQSKSTLAVLLAEDSPVNRRVMQLRLQKLGHQVEAVANGQEALEAATARPFDLILMDIQMPVMSGTAAIAKIRKLSGPYASIPIVALTGLTEPEETKSVIAAGADNILIKPIDGVALNGVLADAQARHSTSRSATEEIT